MVVYNHSSKNGRIISTNNTHPVSFSSSSAQHNGYDFSTSDSATASSIIVSPFESQAYSYHPQTNTNGFFHASDSNGGNNIHQNGSHEKDTFQRQMVEHSSPSMSYPPKKSTKQSLLGKLFGRRKRNHGDDSSDEEEIFIIDSKNGGKVYLKKDMNGIPKDPASSIYTNINSADAAVGDEKLDQNVFERDVNQDYFVLKKKKSIQEMTNEIYNEPISVTENVKYEDKQTRLLKKSKKQEKLWKEIMSHKKTGLFFSVWNLINDIISPGTVSMPGVVAQSGLYMSIIWFVVFGIITIFTLCLVYELARRHLKRTLPDLAMKGFGKIGFLIACVCIFFFNFGGACAQLLMFGQVVPDLLLYLFNDPNNIFISRRAILTYLVVLILPIAMQKRLGSFAFFSFIAVASVFGVAALVNYELFFGVPRYVPHDPKEAFAFVHPQFMNALGNLAYIYICHDMSFHVFDELRRATRLRYYIVVLVTVALTVAACSAMGIGGYLLFWDKNLRIANVLEMFPKGATVAIIGRILLTTSLIFSIPYSAFLPRNVIILIVKFLFPRWYNSPDGFFKCYCWNPWRKRKPPIDLSEQDSLIIHEVNNQNLQHNNSNLATIPQEKDLTKKRAKKFKQDFVHYAATLFVMALGLTIALSVTDLGIVFQITGGVSACAMAYILPCALAIKLEPGRFTLLKIASAITLLGGLVILGSTIYFVILQLVNGK
ncbi:hypothetical protein C9374_011662 [Naegleria lovaniensis]|uniref:Amino acid transporter transmembrane domain-containing protein n=1 Tax=Naegleria lovaniensis TaxID=51637 RepID=A0AA88G9X2_NAELO|nr:uncharacterized protein C9374_011662 [Naegleria lovaniensis]KAG2373997.1 hypothetical protein C9374_011662 [Naegleria lovaniensis]